MHLMYDINIFIILNNFLEQIIYFWVSLLNFVISQASEFSYKLWMGLHMF